MKKLKGLFIGDMVTPTGFSRVLHSILKHLNPEEFEVVGLGVNYRGDPHSYQFRIYPAALGGDVYGLNRLPSLLTEEKFDFIFILNDVWIVNKYLETLKKIKEKVELPKIIVYFPVDSEQHDKEWYANFDIVSKAVVYTSFGHGVVKELFPDMELNIIPHGVDTEIFYKKFTTRKIAKKSIFASIKNLHDSFIVLNANRNQPRKRLDITMKGFSMFAKDKPENVKLYMHCGIRDAAVDIAKIAERNEMVPRLIVTSIKQGVQSIPDGKLNDIYNACDVGINTSMGEGWGLTSIEHAVTGAPQIVPNHSACREVFSDCGLLLPSITDFTFDHILTVGKLVAATDVADKLQLLYDDKKLYNQLSEKSVEKFNLPEFQWSEIAKTWEKLIKEATE